MRATKHTSALSSHYDHDAIHYDQHNEENSRVINETIAKILKRLRVKTVLDMTCGTGSQVFWLLRCGFQVSGVDINKRMLAVARAKAKSENVTPQLLLGDMRTKRVGSFDACLSIFNAIGHLTKSDFKKAIKNIAHNLKPGGLFVFDINNLDYLLHENNITTLTIDWQKKTPLRTHRIVQHSTINERGILASYTTTYDQTASGKVRLHHAAQTLQVYDQDGLRDMLEECGFRVIKTCAVDGRAFSKLKSDRMLTVAKKVRI